MQFKFRLAAEKDSDALCRILEESPMDGKISITMERHPNYFHAAHVQCSRPLITVACDESSHTIGMVFATGTRPVYLNGDLASVRYLSDLRIAPPFRKGLLANRCFKHLRNILKDDEYAQTLVHSNNKSALSLLTSKRASLPYYHPAGDYHCYRISTKQKMASPKNGLTVRRADEKDLQKMQRLFDEEAKNKQFYPNYNFSELDENEYYRDITLRDFFLAFDKEELVGIVGLWDQKNFKQIRIQKYSKWLNLSRLLYNFTVSHYFGIKIPEAGSTLEYLYLHSVICRNNSPEILKTILSSIFKELKKSKFSYFVLGLDSRDPLNKAVKKLRKLNYKGKHFLVSKSSEPPPQFDRNSIFYFEAARI